MAMAVTLVVSIVLFPARLLTSNDAKLCNFSSKKAEQDPNVSFLALAISQ
jgi:hypothetical protein